MTDFDASKFAPCLGARFSQVSCSIFRTMIAGGGRGNLCVNSSHIFHWRRHRAGTRGHTERDNSPTRAHCESQKHTLKAATCRQTPACECCGRVSVLILCAAGRAQTLP